MDRTITAAISAPPDRVLEIVSDLATYPHWLELVTEASPCPSRTEKINSSPTAHEEEPPAWLITLRAKIGPFARSKRLRMVQASLQSRPGQGGETIFKREELDEREHSAWVMRVAVQVASNSPTSDSAGTDHCEVRISLNYDGNLWSGALEAVLGAVVGSAGRKLSAFAAETP